MRDQLTAACVGVIRPLRMSHDKLVIPRRQTCSDFLVHVAFDFYDIERILPLWQGSSTTVDVACRAGMHKQCDVGEVARGCPWSSRKKIERA